MCLIDPDERSLTILQRLKCWELAGLTVPLRSSLDANFPGKRCEPNLIPFLTCRPSPDVSFVSLFLVSFIEPIHFTSAKVLEEMENLNAKEMREKVAQALVISKQKSDKKKETAQGEATGTPPPKSKTAAPGRG